MCIRAGKFATQKITEDKITGRHLKYKIGGFIPLLQDKAREKYYG